MSGSRLAKQLITFCRYEERTYCRFDRFVIRFGNLASQEKLWPDDCQTISVITTLLFSNSVYSSHFNNDDYRYSYILSKLSSLNDTEEFV